MIKVSHTVRQIIILSEDIVSALNEGLLNLSAYAKKIHPDVEKICKKKVNMGTIVAALMRLNGQIPTTPPSLSKLVIEDISIKTGLTSLTYERTGDLANQIRTLYKDGKFDVESVLFTCIGIGEVSFFVYEKNSKLVKDFYKKYRLKFNKSGLVSITVRLADEAISTPNHTYTIFRALVMKKISVIDNISTYSESTYIVEEKDLNESITAINELLKK